MAVATFWWGGRRHVGRLSSDRRELVPLALGPRAEQVGALALIEAQAAGGPEPRAAGPALPLSAVRLDAPIPAPRRNIFCVGLNYRQHHREFAASGVSADMAEEPDCPVIFTKVPDCVIAPGAPIEIPERLSTAIDYEAELLVVIGRPGKAIPASRALEHVWGYAAFNDVTARDLQRRHRQWLIGKSLDTFGPMGPWLVEAGELDAADLRLRCWVNDELRQDGRTRDLIFGVPQLIEAISAGITLQPGDLIATGTPAGVGIGFNPPKYLRRGDQVRIEIEGIGILQNPVR